jgi:hypothetical protein
VNAEMLRCVATGRWVAKLVARLLALLVRIQTSIQNIKWVTRNKEKPTHSYPPKYFTKNAEMLGKG